MDIAGLLGLLGYCRPAPEVVLAVVGLAIVLSSLLYLLIDAISYKRVRDLDVQLKDGQ